MGEVCAEDAVELTATGDLGACVDAQDLVGDPTLDAPRAVGVIGPGSAPSNPSGMRIGPGDVDGGCTTYELLLPPACDGGARARPFAPTALNRSD